ncbi:MULTISPECIES: lysophospholipid acyltransferase family protein [unclassified Campylobacter]|uniref:lysophospholipid acyltransferase family protein n=1 Tax=unclassified Campylobacter TaxID=2593542 RepID=UPI001237C7DA|nr:MULTISPECIES: lysophospholipid acyltransferase family protein [unclassified Campylobacter]KAA6225529.1 1-acyl-sn-glycerol-3-phosphate acyltransferase [Campylobacter sp. LR196d]KAA6226966.1 1-acyl-sn-glycerol-3-phosphate acyltransferase [Campylobacter sp. LR185c]KAA6229800.1 1-acyl-sn-glycerol-3-phosphate acyltransferase [Campylobacter sp. LR286c]KAA6234325.1 1-acyl-sn-glycerol-3-phosphate acyltransferase [Campylobacter sp. LR291e]KAA8604065.1 1-acyl-sn-glycerol-3-phosphate acyltransferase [
MIYKRIKALIYWCNFIFSVALVLIFFCFLKNQNIIYKIRHNWAKMQRYIINYSIDLEGEFDKEAKMIIMNHQSVLDIIALEDLYPANLAWIAKKELAQIPVFKIAMLRPKFLCIDRKNPRDLVRILKEAKQRLSEGRVLSIFPEGTRSKSEKLLKFQSGAAVLAQKLNIKVQPILIVDSAKILDTKNFTASSGVLKMIALPIVDTNDEKWLENTRKLMQERLDKERLKNTT